MGEPTAPTGPWTVLRDAAADRSSGSAAVARIAADALAQLAAAVADDPRPTERIAEAVGILVRGQPIMAACLHLSDAVLRAAASGTDAAASAASDFTGRLARERAGLTAVLRSFVPSEGTVLTVSSSSTIISALREGVPDRTRIVCALSEPGGEGGSAADALNEAGVSAEVVPDAAVAGAAASADLVVFGADAVGPGHLLNKAGTLGAALGASHGRGVCITACGTTKFLGRRAWDRVRALASTRTASAEGTAPVSVFEPVPLNLLFRVLTEDGPLTPAAARKLATRSHLDQRILDLLDEAAL